MSLAKFEATTEHYQFLHRSLYTAAYTCVLVDMLTIYLVFSFNWMIYFFGCTLYSDRFDCCFLYMAEVLFSRFTASYL